MNLFFQQLNTIDTHLFYLINHLPHNPALDIFAIFIHLLTLTGIIFFLTSIYVYFFLDKKEKYLPILALTIFLITWLTSTFILKPIFQRARPSKTVSNVILIGQIPDNNSFPSGQAITAMAFAVPFFLLSRNRKLKRYLTIIVLITGLDRIYMGHHFPFDILGGYILGLLFAYVGVVIYRSKFKSKAI